MRVGSENRQQVLGHISLLGYDGELIHPLCTGGPSESALGDPLEVAMAEWAERCRAQGGLVVMPHAPDPQVERAADIVLGLVHAIELMTFNPGRRGAAEPVRPGRLVSLPEPGLPPAAGRRLGQDVGLVAARRRSAPTPSSATREFSYEAWMDAVRRGDTFVTVGPLVSLEVEGVRPGGRVELPAGGGRVSVQWRLESVALGAERVEVVAGGEVAAEVVLGGRTSAAGSAEIETG